MTDALLKVLLIQQAWAQATSQTCVVSSQLKRLPFELVLHTKACKSNVKATLLS